MKRHLIPACRRVAGMLFCLSMLAVMPVPAQPVQAVDARGTTLRLAQPARRIIALAPNLTELAFAAGAGGHLAGVARFSDHPPAARRLPVVSDALQFDLEHMLALRADLVLAWHSGTPPEAIARMERAGLPVFVAGAAGLDDIARNLDAIARLAGTEAAGGTARRAFESGLRELRSRPVPGSPVRVFYEIWGRPLMTVSGSHLISEVIALCGGSNVFGGLRALTPEVSREALIAAHPQVILGGSSADTPDTFAARWAAMPPPLNAMPAHHVQPDLMQRPTPRILEGAKRVCSVLDAVRAAGR